MTFCTLGCSKNVIFIRPMNVFILEFQLLKYGIIRLSPSEHFQGCFKNLP